MKCWFITAVYCIRETALRTDFRNNKPHYIRTAIFATSEVINLKLRVARESLTIIELSVFKKENGLKKRILGPVCYIRSTGNHRSL